MRPELTQVEVRDRLHYDSGTGAFTWINPAAPQVSVGAIAGTADRHGHIRISLHNKGWAAHRLAWLYVYGEWPSGVIDHINGCRADNRIANLRDVTQSQNLHNQRQPKRGSKTGVVGVSWDEKREKYYAQIAFNRKRYKLGRFDTLAEAKAAYLAAKERLHGGYPMERAA